MTVIKDCKTTVSGMWQGKDAFKLDAVASNNTVVLWWNGGAKRSMHRPLHVLRFRFLEVKTKAKH
jgi:hypothetical protein